VRRALSELQAAGVRHVAVDQATEAIAGALSLVHQLTAALGQGSVVPSPPTQPSGSFQSPGELPPQVAVVNASAAQRPATAPNPNAPTQLAPNWGQQTAPAGQVWQPPPPQAPAYAAPAQPAAAPAAPVGPSGALRFEAELGAHSSTNFYKGLSGNDVIDSGGIFIATYNIPDVGQPLSVKVCLPGGYEFEAAAIVRWTRDSPQSGADSSPGFGAQFTQISAEGRQLVYRYVRNREPLFYDDL
jgi:PilZ domain